MAQVKLLKLNAEGLVQEFGASDDITLNTVTGATQIGVTNGVTITSNITFNATTDTIAGIANENLLSRVADEEITGNYTIAANAKLILTDQPTLDSHATNKGYVDARINGLYWQNPIISQIDFTAAEPETPNEGDRYIHDGADGTSSGTSQNVFNDHIYIWNGDDWTDLTPENFWTLADLDLNIYLTFNGTDWVSMGSVVAHNSLSGLQGGNGTNEFYHLDAAEHTFVSDLVTRVTDEANILTKNINETISADFTMTGKLDITNGAFVVPAGVTVAPVEGSIIYDDQILQVYNGTEFVPVGATGTASAVVTSYIAAVNITSKQLVYISTDDQVSPANAGNTNSRHPVGFATAAILQGEIGVIQEDGLLTGVLTGAIPNTVYYMGETNGSLTDTAPTTSGAWVLPVGVAKNSTDLQIRIGTAFQRA